MIEKNELIQEARFDYCDVSVGVIRGSIFAEFAERDYCKMTVGEAKQLIQLLHNAINFIENAPPTP